MFFGEQGQVRLKEDYVVFYFGFVLIWHLYLGARFQRKDEENCILLGDQFGF